MSNFINIRLDNLVETRKLLNYSQKDIALYLAYDRSYYSKIENGLFDLKIKDAIKLCLLYNCDILFIYNIKREYKELSNRDRLLFIKYLESTNDIPK